MGHMGDGSRKKTHVHFSYAVLRKMDLCSCKVKYAQERENFDLVSTEASDLLQDIGGTNSNSHGRTQRFFIVLSPGSVNYRPQTDRYSRHLCHRAVAVVIYHRFVQYLTHVSSPGAPGGRQQR